MGKAFLKELNIKLNVKEFFHELRYNLFSLMYLSTSLGTRLLIGKKCLILSLIKEEDTSILQPFISLYLILKLL